MKKISDFSSGGSISKISVDSCTFSNNTAPIFQGNRAELLVENTIIQEQTKYFMHATWRNIELKLKTNALDIEILRVVFLCGHAL